MKTTHLLLTTLCLGLLALSARGAERFHLGNNNLSADFDERGLARLSMPKSNQDLIFDGDAVSVTINGSQLSVPGLKLIGCKPQKGGITYTYAAGDKQLRVVYELRPEWHFISKQLVLELPGGATNRIDAIEMLRSGIRTPIAREYKPGNSSGAVFLRLGETNLPAEHGVFLALQNPFLRWERKGVQVSISYAPELEWRADYGPFVSDRVCIGLHSLSGFEMPARNMREWEYVSQPEKAFDGKPMLDRSEFDAMSRCIDAFALFRPKKSLRVHVPWCENDYQVDIGTPNGRSEWKRILDRCAAIGVDHALFTPANSAVAPLSENADAWGWENCLWLGLGQKIRKGEWSIISDPIPESIQEMLNYAKRVASN